jgi:Putative beta barrel porin-7 (BBP7)
MRTRLLGSLLLVLAGTGFASARDPASGAPSYHSPYDIALEGACPGACPAACGEDCAEPCVPADCCGGGGCNVPGRFWLTGAYLLWWIKGEQVPPLAATGTPTSQGILGQPGTTVLYGGGPANQGPMSGALVNAAYWLNEERTVGIGGTFFFLGRESNNVSFNSATTPILARPFLNLNGAPATATSPAVAGPVEFAETAAFPGLSTGSVSVRNSTRLGGGQAYALCNLCCDGWYRVDAAAGFMYLNLQESTTITEASQINSNLSAFPAFASLAGNTFLLTDRFATRNQFYGGMLGTMAWVYRGPWFGFLQAAVGLGDTHQVLDVSGNQVRTTPAGVTTMIPGGLLALSSNSGHFTHDAFAVAPFVGLNVGRQITRNLGAFVGYNFLYWSNVVRPTDQIDRAIDVTRIPNFPLAATPLSTPHPTAPFNTTDFWAHGLSFGLQVVW